jgi:DNA polymerase-4
MKMIYGYVLSDSLQGDTMKNERLIIHVDMDAYYASIEQRDNPELRGKPICVGGSPSGRGVVTTCSYEARKYGIHSAMSAYKAQRLCPDAIFVMPRFSVYRDVSKQIRNIFHEYSDIVEPISLDEAYLDLSSNKKALVNPREIAKEILDRIYNETGLTASAGVSFNKFLAKVGSDFNKPNGITVIMREDADAFIDNLPIRKFFGVGKVTEKKMREHGINTGSDLKKYSLFELNKMFGKSGIYFYNMAHGNDTRRVGSYHSRKSIGHERTLQEDLEEHDEIIEILEGIAERLSNSMKRYKLKGKTITLKVKYHDFRRISRSITLKAEIYESDIIMQNILRLIPRTCIGKKRVRLVGISMSNLMPEKELKFEQQLLPI